MKQTHHWVTKDTPRIGILLYRKHVITEQGYIPNMIKLLESDGIMPIPVFINGIEGHTIVRDLFTTKYEQNMRRNVSSYYVLLLVTKHNDDESLFN